MQKVIIIGATTGIGRSLAALYAEKGYEIAVTGRRQNLLDEIKAQYPNTKVHVRQMDVADIEASRQTMDDLAQAMNGIDIVVVNAGVGYINADFVQEIATIDINVRGFLGMTHWAYQYFKEKGKGQIAGISSVAGVRSSPYAPEYHASKAFMSRYMEGLRLRSRKKKLDIAVTDIRPGFVDTPMTKQNKGMFWVATPEKAAQQIYDAIQAKKSIAYITKRYVLLAWLMKMLPEWMLVKMVV